MSYKSLRTTAVELRSRVHLLKLLDWNFSFTAFDFKMTVKCFLDRVGLNCQNVNIIFQNSLDWYSNNYVVVNDKGKCDDCLVPVYELLTMANGKS